MSAIGCRIYCQSIFICQAACDLIGNIFYVSLPLSSTSSIPFRWTSKIGRFGGKANNKIVSKKRLCKYDAWRGLGTIESFMVTMVTISENFTCTYVLYLLPLKDIGEVAYFWQNAMYNIIYMFVDKCNNYVLLYH